MTAAEVRRVLRLLQRERQKGFLAWHQLRRVSEPNKTPDTIPRERRAPQLVQFPLTHRDGAGR